MTYKDFKETYSWMLKEYPGTDNIYREDMTEEIGTCEIVNYEKSGSRWKEISNQTRPISRVFYMNCVDAIPFFKGLGGTERVTMGYTRVGYIPTEISSISPDKQRKTMRVFRFA